MTARSGNGRNSTWDEVGIMGVHENFWAQLIHSVMNSSGHDGRESDCHRILNKRILPCSSDLRWIHLLRDGF